MSLDEQLRRQLKQDAAQVEPAPADLDGVVGRAKRRRRHAGLAGGFAVVGVVAVGLLGYFAITGDEPSSDIETVPVEQDLVEPEPEPTANTTEEAAPVETETVETLSAEPLTIQLDIPELGDQYNSYQPSWLLPWHEGFLLLHQVPPATPFPELTEAQRSLFPQEVMEIFDADPATTVEDATSRVIESGYVNEVVAVLEANPELNELLRTNVEPPGQEALWSTDGASWETLDVEFPEGHLAGAHSDGQHLLLSIQSSGPTNESPSRIATTSDLEEWNFQAMPDPTVQFHELAETHAEVAAVGLGDDGWVALVNTNSWLDPSLLLPSEIREQIPMSEFGMNFDESGITITLDGERTTYGWSELGISQDEFEAATTDRGQLFLLGAEWDGQATASPLPGEFGSSIAITDAGYMAILGDENGIPRVWFSDDGSNWDQIEIPAGMLPPSRLWATDGGVLVAQPDGLLRGNADGSEWTRLEIAGLETLGMLREGPPSQAATPPGIVFVADVASYDTVPIDEVRLDQDGYELRIFRLQSETMRYYEIREIDAVGPRNGLIGSKRIEVGKPLAEQEGPIYRREDGSIVLTDEATGKPLVTFSRAAIEDAIEREEYLRQYDISFQEPENSRPALLASSDGERWLLSELDLDFGDSPLHEFFWLTRIALNGDRAVVQMGDEILVYDLS